MDSSAELAAGGCYNSSVHKQVVILTTLVLLLIPTVSFADNLSWGSETNLIQSSECPIGSVVVNVQPQWNGSYNDTLKTCRSVSSTPALTWGSETNLIQSSECPIGSVVVNVQPQWNGSYNDTLKTCRSVSASTPACSTPATPTTDSKGFTLLSNILNRLINTLGFNFCISNSSTLNYFIPAHTTAELQSFYNAIPRLSGVSQQAP